LPVQARARASRSASWQARPDAVALGIRGSGGRPTVQLAARENSRQPRSARSRPFP
jgi:hypothetical protein